MNFWKEKFLKESLLIKNPIRRNESKAKSDLGLEDKKWYNGNFLSGESDENDFNKN